MKNFLAILFLIFISVFFYTLTIRGVNGNPTIARIKKERLGFPTSPFELSSERGRYLLVYSLAEYHSFALPKPLGELAMPDVGYYRGKFYIYFAPGISLLALPAYEIGKMFGLAQVLSFSVISFFAALNLLVIFFIGRKIFKMPIWASLISAIIFGFATTSWSYAVTLYQHETTTYFLLSSVLFVWIYKKRRRLSWVFAAFVWFNFAYSLMIDYPNIIFMIPVISYFFLSSVQIRRFEQKININIRLAFILTFSVFLIVSGIHGYINYSNFGDWKRINGSLPSYRLFLENTKDNKLDQVQQSESRSQSSTVSKFFLEERLIRGLNTLTLADDKGLFLFSPVLLIGLLGIYKGMKKITMEQGVLLSILLTNLLLYASWNDPWGGWAYGPRYLLPTMAILALYLGYWLSSVKKRWLWAILTFVLCIYSSAVGLLGAITTNSVPPKSEAIILHAKYGVLAPVDYLLKSTSSSFIYKTFVYKDMNLFYYYLIILGILLAIMYIILFIMPLFETQKGGG